MMTSRKVIGGAVGSIGIGLLLWGIILPQFNNKTANESLESINQTSFTPTSTTSDQQNPPMEMPEMEIIKTGMFQSLNRQQTKGTVLVIKNESGRLFVRLDDDFSVSKGPDLYVGFGTSGRVDESSLLPRLKATSGSQNYELPEGFEVTKYTQVFIYCKAFSYPFGVANLQ